MITVGSQRPTGQRVQIRSLNPLRDRFAAPCLRESVETEASRPRREGEGHMRPRREGQRCLRTLDKAHQLMMEKSIL
jgi:hypothetical protein